VGIRDQAGRMLKRTWSKAETLEAMPWLKRENAKGADVYVRPAGENAGLVLVDDLNRGQLARMKADGVAPACVTETSPDNFQAWVRVVRVNDRPLQQDLATAVAKDLANRYGGDPNSADWRHFGRLAGLTNAKPKHKDASGRSPYVLAHESGGKVAPAGLALVQQAAQRVLDREAQAERRIRVEAIRTAPEAANGRDPVQMYRHGLKALYARFGESMDVSKADYMIGVDMARRGFSPAQIGQAIEQASPELPTRKAGHEADYVARTVKAVMASPKVAEWQQEQAKEAQQRSSRRERDSGPSIGM
ncbi:MAG: DNA-primase RepB domain-containing protein, partial [bacterium]